MGSHNNIITERLLLRSFNDTDLENVFLGLSHPDVIKYYGISFKTIEATKEQLSWFKNLEKTNTGIWWAICSKDNSIFYGAVGFNNIEAQHHKAELGFWLTPTYWRKGILSECLPLIINYAFEKLKLQRIEAFVETENTSCKKVLSKFNFRHEDTIIDAEFKNDIPISLDIFSFSKEN